MCTGPPSTCIATASGTWFARCIAGLSHRPSITTRPPRSRFATRRAACSRSFRQISARRWSSSDGWGSMRRRRVVCSGSRRRRFADASIGPGRRSTDTWGRAMPDLRSYLDRAIGPVHPSPDVAFERTLRRARQRQLRRRYGAIAVGLAASVVAAGFAVWAFSGGRHEQPAAPEGRVMFVGGDNLTGAYRLYTMNADGSGLRSIPTGDLVPFAAAPSPDGDRIAMMASEPWPKGEMPTQRLYLMDARGGRIREMPVCPSDGCQGTITISWSPDGRALAFPGNGVGIRVVDVETGQTRTLTGGGIDCCPQFSRDGLRIVFERTEPALGRANRSG